MHKFLVLTALCLLAAVPSFAGDSNVAAFDASILFAQRDIDLEMKAVNAQVREERAAAGPAPMTALVFDCTLDVVAGASDVGLLLVQKERLAGKPGLITIQERNGEDLFNQQGRCILAPTY